MRQVFLYIAGIISIVWGIIHLFPSKQFVLRYGKLVSDKTQIANTEWIIVSIIMILLGLLILGFNVISSKNKYLAKATQFISPILLAVLLLLSLYCYPV